MSMTAAALAACLSQAAETYKVPPAVLVAIMRVEGGRIGQEVGNTNGSYDLGPMQVNTIHLAELAKLWGVNKDTARTWVRDDGCVNVNVAAWILRDRINDSGSLATGIAHYHSRTPVHGQKYARRVNKALSDMGLLARNVPSNYDSGGTESKSISASAGSSARHITRNQGHKTRVIVSRGNGTTQITRTDGNNVRIIRVASQ